MDDLMELMLADDSSIENARRFVAAGAEQLDSGFMDAPANWRAMVDLQKLDIFSGWNCVLGQVLSDSTRDSYMASGYIAATRTLAEAGMNTSLIQAWGFCPSPGANRWDLEAAWREELAPVAA